MVAFPPQGDHHTASGPVAGSATAPLEGNFRWLAGRRYFANVPYLLPYDEHEFTRLDFEHYLLRQALKANVLAPVDQPRGILDVGAGTGRWVLEVASQFPLANVIGVDLVPSSIIERTGQEIRNVIGGSGASQPMNCTFVAGNVLTRLPFADGTFDYVHMRFLSAAIPLARWRQVMYELARVTRQRGWIEVVDTAWTPLNGGTATEQLYYWARIAGMVREINLQIAAWIGNLFLDSGLSSVTAPRLQLPMGRGGGRIGSMVAANAIAVAEAIQPWVVAYHIATEEAFTSALAAVRAEVMEGTCAYPIFVAYGQRF
jgi:ubiquinone/menaquinone biosynthesis C-methylase UbiE